MREMSGVIIRQVLKDTEVVLKDIPTAQLPVSALSVIVMQVPGYAPEVTGVDFSSNLFHTVQTELPAVLLETKTCINI